MREMDSLGRTIHQGHRTLAAGLASLRRGQVPGRARGKRLLRSRRWSRNRFTAAPGREAPEVVDEEV